jgi:hypothetical protein
MGGDTQKKQGVLINLQGDLISLVILKIGGDTQADGQTQTAK